jgi:hypothetical protein
LSARGSCVMEDVDDMESTEPDTVSLTLSRDYPHILEMVDAV